MDITEAGERAKYAREIDPEGKDSLAKVVRLIAPGSTVLDVGCGPGALGRFLRERKGCTVDGIENDPALAALAKPYYRALHAADLESADLAALLPQGEYDAIVCADVLEHVRNPGKVLRQLKGALKDGGRILISIPNVGYAGVVAGLLAGEFVYTPEGLLDDTHVRFFTRASLLRLLEQEGLQPLTIDFVTHTLEESEFRKHRIERLPTAVRTAILGNPDAFTYQFIVEAIPGTGAVPVIAGQPPPKLLFNVQLYWRTATAHYSGDTCVSASGEIGVDPQEIRLTLPKLDAPPQGLRLDPADRHGFVRVRSVVLRDAAGGELWRWDGDALSLTAAPSHGLVEFSSSRNRWWMSTSDDPFIELPVPAEALARCSEGSLTLDVGWPMSADSFAAERVLAQEMLGWNARTEHLETQLKSQLEGATARIAEQGIALAAQARTLAARAVTMAEQGKALAEHEQRLAAASQATKALEERATSAEEKLRAAHARLDVSAQAALELATHVQALEAIHAAELGRAPALHPRHNVHASPDPAFQWESTGAGAQFLVGGGTAPGWHRIVWSGRSDVPVLLQLFVDYGRGFPQEPTQIIGVLDGAERTEAVYVAIDRSARALRLQVGSQPARFSLRIEEWSWRPSAVVQLVTLRGLLRTPRELLRTATRMARRGMAPWREFRQKLLIDRFVPPESAALPTAATESAETAAQREGAAKAAAARAEKEAAIARFRERPLVSVVVPCYDTDPRWLADAVASVREQVYPHWELILVDDGSKSPQTRAALKELDGPRIRVIWQEKNGGISAATNAGLQAARGELLALLDHDDTLAPDALFEVVRRFDEQPGLQAVYTDQDKLDESGQRYENFFKPDWSPELLRGVMYVGHLLVVRRELALALGGFDSRFDKVQDFEFMLRVSERTGRVGHVAKVLYHWRAVQGSVAKAPGEKSGITGLQARAVTAHLQRLGVQAIAEPHPQFEHRVLVKPAPLAQTPLVSIVIPTRDAPEHISRCLDSIFAKTTYPRFEVVVVDNGTTDEAALAAIRKHPVTVVPFREKFNFSKANNLGAAAAKGEILVLLNNDTEVIDAGWLDTFVFYLQQPGVGMVGPMLLYPDRSVQHAGVVLGFRGTADHVMRGFPADSDGYAGSLSCTREVSGVTAACLALRRADWDKVGGLVDHYGTHYQDVDLCLRIRALGERILFVPRARLFHHESASRGGSYDHLDRALLLDSWGEVIGRGDPYYNPNFTLEKHDYSPR